MLRRVRVAGTDEFVLQRLELLLRSEFVCLFHTWRASLADIMVEGEVVERTMLSLS